MLSLEYKQDRIRQAANLIPTDDGGMESRMGARQIIDGDVNSVAGWGEFLVAARNGRVVVSDGSSLTDVTQAGRFLRGSSYQALTANAEREDRFYIADGIRKLWYLVRRNGVFEVESVVNSVLDADGLPYELPVPTDVATWRNRLWIIYGSNRARHCQNEQPEEWDPLWTIEAQGKAKDKIVGLFAQKDALLLALKKSVWGVAGTSHLNWDKGEVSVAGIGGANAIDADDAGPVIANSEGVFRFGSDEALSDDIRLAFSGFDSEHLHIKIDKKRRLCYVLVMGRLFVLNLKTSRWGEIVNIFAAGLFEWQGEIGWYGADGVWLLFGFDQDDKRLDDTTVPVVSVFESWVDQPNKSGGMRAVYRRGYFAITGSPRGDASYTVTVDENTSEEKIYTQSMSLSDVDYDVWSDAIVDGDGESWRVPPVLREVTPQLAGSSFRHTLSAPCYMKFLSFKPGYDYGVEE